MLMDVNGMLQWDLVLQFCYVFLDHRCIDHIDHGAAMYQPGDSGLIS